MANVKKVVAAIEEEVVVTVTEEIDDVTEITGDVDMWICICKAVNKKEDWMKSTKVLNMQTGCLVQVSTRYADRVAEAVTYVPNVNWDVDNKRMGRVV
jgi:hypothetical protein